MIFVYSIITRYCTHFYRNTVKHIKLYPTLPTIFKHKFDRRRKSVGEMWVARNRKGVEYLAAWRAWPGAAAGASWRSSRPGAGRARRAARRAARGSRSRSAGTPSAAAAAATAPPASRYTLTPLLKPVQVSLCNINITVFLFFSVCSGKCQERWDRFWRDSSR